MSTSTTFTRGTTLAGLLLHLGEHGIDVPAPDFLPSGDLPWTVEQEHLPGASPWLRVRLGDGGFVSEVEVHLPTVGPAGDPAALQREVVKELRLRTRLAEHLVEASAAWRPQGEDAETEQGKEPGDGHGQR